jgi:hypothetical protein
MPGALPHLFAGSLMFLVGRFYFRTYFNNKIKKQFFLLIICLLFSFIPDFFLIIYYSTYLFSFEFFLLYHNIVFLLSVPIAIIAIFILTFGTNIETKPLWIMGFWCIILHIIMDLFLPHNTYGIWI